MYQTIFTFGLASTLIFLVVILISPVHNRRNKFLFTGYILTVVSEMSVPFFWSYNSQFNAYMVSFIPLGFFIFVTSFLTGPFYYILLGYIFGYRSKEKGISLEHFIPAGITISVIIILIVIGEILIYNHLSDLHAIKKIWFIVLGFLAIFYIIQLNIYYFLVIKNLFIMKKNIKEERVGILMTAGHLITLYSFIAMFIFVDFKFYGKYISIIYAYDAVINIASVVLSTRYPRLSGFREITDSSWKIKKPLSERNSLLLDFDDIEKKLNYALNVEKIYRVENLSLNMLANEIRIHPYQLTHYLSVRAGKNFNSLVNSYRVDEAKDLLAKSPDKTIISIAFETGFNSKSSFNRVFQNITGMSPSDYRVKFSTLSSLPQM